MPRPLPAKILDQIATVVSSAQQAQVLIRVYAEAEIIRGANIEENIALEDIVQALIDHSAKGPGCDNDPDDARATLIGVTSPSATLH